MKTLYFLLSILILATCASCEKTEFCTPIHQECTVSVIYRMWRCEDPETGEMGPWNIEAHEDTYIVKSECSLEKLTESVMNENQSVEGFDSHSLICVDIN